MIKLCIFKFIRLVTGYDTKYHRNIYFKLKIVIKIYRKLPACKILYDNGLTSLSYDYCACATTFESYFWQCSEITIFTFDFKYFLKRLVALSSLPIEPNTLQQNSEKRLYSRHEFHYLNVPNVATIMVTDEFDCCFKCLRNPSCFSVNLAAFQTVSKQFWCELLPSHKYNSPDKYQQNKSSHHISIMVRFVF